MSKKPVILSAVEAEASAQFSLMLRLLRFGSGRFGRLKIHPARDHLETKRVKIETTFADEPIAGEIVLITKDEQWQLYCGASDIRFRDWHAGFAFDYAKQVYHIGRYYDSGGYEPMTVNMVTGEHKVFCDPADAPI